MSLRVVFMGTPEYGAKSLKKLIESGYNVVGVFTQPDRPKGRGGKVIESSVKTLALKNNIPVFQPKKIRLESVEELKGLDPDVCVTAAFGQILSKELLDIPKLGTVNVHASLLPKYRGSAPVNWCLINGETKTGVTTMMTDVGIDTGDILLKSECEIFPGERCDELLERLGDMGAELLIKTLEKLEKGELSHEKQDENEMSYYPLIKKELGNIDWNKKAKDLENLCHGLYPWPCVSCDTKYGRLKILRARAEKCEKGKAGEILVADDKKGLLVKAGEGALWLVEVQGENANKMNAKDYLRGHALTEGSLIFEGEA